MKRIGMLSRKQGGWGKRKVKVTQSGMLIKKRKPSKKHKRRM
jgi:hypothetical protein